MRTLIMIQESTADSLSVEELILAQAQLKTIDAAYQEMKLDTPEWVIDKLSEVGLEITVRVRSELQRRLKTAKSRRSALRTADERRKELDAEIAELESKVG